MVALDEESIETFKGKATVMREFFDLRPPRPYVSSPALVRDPMVAQEKSLKTAMHHSK